jgi:hypothetical protein
MKKGQTFQPIGVNRLSGLQKKGVSLRDRMIMEYLARLQKYRSWPDEIMPGIYEDFRDLYVADNGEYYLPIFNAKTPKEMKEHMARIHALNVGHKKLEQFFDLVIENGGDWQRADSDMMKRMHVELYP